jgi:hypothetical protein
MENNMTSKLKIDLSTGLLEVEGSEDLIKFIYGDFKDNLGTLPPVQTVKLSEIQTVSDTKVVPKKVTLKAAPTKNSSKSKSKKEPEFLKNLDLSVGSENESLKDFYAKYDHKSNYERNLIFVYYIQHILHEDKITLDHLFTCYRNVGQKIPKALEQSMRDTSKEKGWVDIDDLENIKVPVAGMNHIEHDLAKNEA